MRPTALLADFACRMRDEPLDRAVRERAVTCLLDVLGLAVSAHAHSAVRAVNSICTVLPAGSPGATLLATGDRVSVAEACLGNGIAAHAHFQDDCDLDAWAHPGSLIVPVALGAAQLRRQPLEIALRGIVAGYGALNWLGADGVIGHALVERGFRASPTLGTIAAAVAAATVLGLDVGTAADAIGLATDVTGGLLEPVRSGAADWRWQNGNAASRGVTAALLAEAGLIGPPDSLGGPCGFARTFCEMDAPSQWHRPPTADAILRIWFKRYPLLGDNMAVALAAAALHGRVGDPSAIARVDVHLNEHFASYPGTAYAGPFDTVEQAVASTAYAVSALLVDGDIVYDDYAGKLSNAAILQVVDRVRVVPEKDYGMVDGRVVVHGPSGERWAQNTADCPRELLFRDRAEAAAAYDRCVPPGDRRSEVSLPGRLFAWLDGGDEPAVDEVIVNSGRARSTPTR